MSFNVFTWIIKKKRGMIRMRYNMVSSGADEGSAV